MSSHRRPPILYHYRTAWHPSGRRYRHHCFGEHFEVCPEFTEEATSAVLAEVQDDGRNR